MAPVIELCRKTEIKVVVVVVLFLLWYSVAYFLFQRLNHATQGNNVTGNATRSELFFFLLSLDVHSLNVPLLFRELNRLPLIKSFSRIRE